MTRSEPRFDGWPSRVLSWTGDRKSDVLKRVLGVRVRTEGFETAVFAAGPVLIAANHLSLLDTVVVRYALPPAVRARTATVGARDFFAPGDSDRGLRRIAKSISCGYISGTYRVCLIGRGDDMGDGLPRIERLLASGWHVILFPEGTRSRNGAMGRFRLGVAHLARHAGVPVLPVHITGTERVMPVGSRWIHPGTIELRAGRPLRCEPGETHQDFLERMRRAIEAAGRVPGGR